MWIQANATKQRLHKQQLHTKIKQISLHFIYYSLLLSYTASTHAILKLLTLNKILYTTSNVCKIRVLLAVYAQFPLFSASTQTTLSRQVKRTCYVFNSYCALICRALTLSRSFQLSSLTVIAHLFRWVLDWRINTQLKSFIPRFFSRCVRRNRF